MLEDVQVSGAHEYIDAGADIVIGAHPHILQGLEYYHGKPIVYSLGNFWFDSYDTDTMMAEVRIIGQADGSGKRSLDDADVQLVLHPGTQRDVFTAYADTDGWRGGIFEELENMSENVAIDKRGVAREA